jgi:regulator of protease activity HflC (stomatin/prohibitin superfamily)
VLYWLGKVRTEPLGPGIHWRVPYLREIEVVSHQIQWSDLPIQGVASLDGKPIALSVNVAWTVANAVRWQMEVHDAEHAIMNALRPVIAQTVAEYEYEVMYTRLPALSRLIRARCHDAIEHLGAHLRVVGITDFIYTKHYRLLQDTISV